MEPIEWVQVLSYVRPQGNHRRSWPTAMVVLIRLAGWDGGGELTGPDAAAMAGVSDAAGRRVMLVLDQMKIVKRTPRAKLKWCELNQNWRRWDVTWAIPPAAIEAQLALGREERAQNVLERFSARSRGVRSWHRIGRHEGARNRIMEVLEADRIARSKSGGRGATDQTLMSARIVKQAETALGRAHSQAVPQQSSPGVDADQTHAPETQVVSQKQREKDLGATGLVAAIVRAAIVSPGYDRKFLNGPPHIDLLDLVEREGLRTVEEVFTKIEGSYTTLGYVRELELRFADEGLAPSAPAAEEAVPPEYWTPPEPDPEAIDPKEGIRIVRSAVTPGWQDDPKHGEEPEAIAQ